MLNADFAEPVHAHRDQASLFDDSCIPNPSHAYTLLAGLRMSSLKGIPLNGKGLQS